MLEEVCLPIKIHFKLGKKKTEGVMVAKKSFSMQKHGDVDVPNFWVVKLLTSLKSKGLVKEKFSWQWYYWYLTNEGIEYLRDYLNLPPEIVPATLKKPRAPPRSVPRDRAAAPRRPFPTDEKKLAGAGADFAPRFVSSPLHIYLFAMLFFFFGITFPRVIFPFTDQLMRL